jgi:hypothetical protein
MQLIEVTTAEHKREFLELPSFIYKDNPYWVRPLDSMIENVFNPNTNHFHSHGKCIRWILQDNNGKTIGRVAAFINDKKVYATPVPTGGMGFFECINDQQAANRLFDACKQWLADNGMHSMLGNINFGENDNWWGLLIEGFEKKPSFGMNYHLPYYQELFNHYGFVKEYEQITNSLVLATPFPERFTKIAKWVMNKPGYTFEPFSYAKLNKFACDFLEIYNDGWKDFEGFTPLTMETVMERLREMKPIADPKLIWFAYVNGEPASFIVIIPDANEFIYNINGKLNFIGKIKFAINRWRKAKRMRAIIMGTKSNYRKLGLESCLFIKLKEYVIPMNQYEELELSWVGDFNDQMISIHHATGATFSKRHATLRFNF